VVISSLAGVVLLGSGVLVGPAASADPISTARAQAAAASARLNALDATMYRLDEALDQAQNRLDRVNTQLAAAQAQYARAQAQVAADRQAMRTQAVSDYMQGGDIPAFQQLVQSDATSEVVKQSYISSVASVEQGAVDALHSALLQFSQSQAELASARQAAQAAVDQVRSARDASAAAAGAEAGQLSRLQGQVASLVAQDQAAQATAAAARLQARYHDTVSGPLPPPGQGAGTAVAWARAEVGKPYQYGAAGPDSFDCSGLTMYVWAQAGVSLPHSAAGQWDATTRVPVSDLQPGDLVFYYQPVDHVGIYVGGGEMIVADHTGTNVRYASIYRDGLDGGGRVSG